MRLDPSDASFVDVIHTNSPLVGTPTRCGHIDFWPNGGEFQRGCSLSGMQTYFRNTFILLKLYYTSNQSWASIVNSRQNVTIAWNKNILLTEFEGRKVSYRTSFLLRQMARAHSDTYGRPWLPWVQTLISTFFRLTSDILDGVNIVKCHHHRARHFYTDSIMSSTPFQSYPCSNWDQFTRGNCMSCGTGNECPEMGYNAIRNKGKNNGDFYLYTNDDSPYAGKYLSVTLYSDEWLTSKTSVSCFITVLWCTNYLFTQIFLFRNTDAAHTSLPLVSTILPIWNWTSWNTLCTVFFLYICCR